MFHGRLYFVLLVLCWAYALLRGGLPERIGATILVVGSVLTYAALPRWVGYSAEAGFRLFIIDTICFGAFALLALRVDRFWPIWVSALLGLGVLGHLAHWYGGSELDRWVYAMSLAIWSYPILALIAIGTLSHQRRAAERRDWEPA